MAIGADILRRLGALKLSSEVMAEVLDIIAKVQEDGDRAADELERFKSANRERQARWKSKHQGNVTNDVSANVTCPPPLKEEENVPHTPYKEEENTPLPLFCSESSKEDSSLSSTGVDLLGFDLAQEVTNLWNDLARKTGLPKVKAITKTRESLIRGRAKDLQCFDHKDPLDGFRDLFAKIRASPFLSGRSNCFAATFDWSMKESNFTKIMEDTYEKENRTDKSRR